MNILFVCHRFPYPPKRGGKIRPFNIIRHLSQRHQVTVASLARSAEELEEGAGLADHCHAVIPARVSAPAAMARMLLRLPTPTPSSMGYFYSPTLRRDILAASETTDFDLVFVHCSSVAQYVVDLDAPRKLLDFGDMDSQKWLEYSRYRRFPLSLGYRLEGAKLEAEEKRLARRFDLCTCTTRAELATLDGFATGAQTGWFPNGVDFGYFDADAAPYDPNMAVFLGRMDYFPNQDAMLRFCRDVFPLVRRGNGEAKLTIVGASPSRQIQELASVEGVSVTGSVPDVRPYVQTACMTVAPLTIARGTQNKVLESMAMGVPVVASELAAGGVDAVPGEHLLTADSPRDVADAVLRLMRDANERQRFSIAGRERVLSHHAWGASMTRLDGLLDRLMA